MKRLLFYTMITVFCYTFNSCNNVEKYKDNRDLSTINFKINSIDFPRALNQAKWFLYLVNISEDSKCLGSPKENYRENENEFISLLSCNPKLHNLYVKNDTMIFHFYFINQEEEIIPNYLPKLEIVYKKSKVISYGISDRYFSDIDQVFIENQENLLFGMLEKNNLGSWLSKNEFVLKKQHSR